MKEVLTNEEIDTLLDLFRSEGPPLDEPASGDLGLFGRDLSEGPLVSTVDLLKPNRISRDQLRALNLSFGGAAKALAATISDRLRLELQCDCVAVEQVRFQSWLKTVGGPLAIYVVRMPPLDLPVLFTMTTALLYGAVDRILGGTGRVSDVPKEFTAAEYTVADALVGPCLDRICDSLEDMAKLSWSIENRFNNPSMAQILPGQDVVLATHFQVSGDFLIGDLRLAVPYVAIEPHIARLVSGPGSLYRVPPGGMREALGATVQRVPVEMSVTLGETEIPLRQLMRLQVGDIVPLPTRVGQPLVAPVQGVPKFLGQVGKHGNRLAFEVGGEVPA